MAIHTPWRATRNAVKRTDGSALLTKLSGALGWSSSPMGRSSAWMRITIIRRNWRNCSPSCMAHRPGSHTTRSATRRMRTPNMLHIRNHFKYRRYFQTKAWHVNRDFKQEGTPIFRNPHTLGGLYQMSFHTEFHPLWVSRNKVDSLSAGPVGLAAKICSKIN